LRADKTAALPYGAICLSNRLHASLHWIEEGGERREERGERRED
jgi:hypothetical protein